MNLSAGRRLAATFRLALLPLFALAAAGPPAAAQTAVTAEGHQLEIVLRPDKGTVMLSEPAFLSFEIRNHSAQELCVLEGGDYRNRLGRPESFTVTVTGDGGKPVPQPEVKFNMGGLLGCAMIPANGSHTRKLFLPHWATFEAAGSYTVNVKKTLAVENNSTQSKSSVEADVSAKIEVVADDEDKLGAVIDSLGGTMLDADHKESERSAQALAAIDDRRVIRYFARALKKFDKSGVGTGGYSQTVRAASALSRFNDDAAVAALEAVMGSRNEETRLAVASAFEGSEHPKAPELLLKMRKDSYWFVRLRVAQGAGKMQSEESLALLRGMLKDEHEQVRNAARDGLKKRGVE